MANIEVSGYAGSNNCMIYCFDIDGTLCTNTDGDYTRAEPFPEVIARVRALYEAGHQIVVHTARGSETGIDWKDATEYQLHSWGVRYHALYFGKPPADFYIDDRAVNIADWLKEAGASHCSPSTDPSGGNAEKA